MRKIATTKNWDSNAYNIGSYMQNYCVDKILNEYTFDEHLQLLDLGCGDGKSTHNILTYAPTAKILGVDRSPDMIRSAKKNYSSNSISFMEKDITCLDSHEAFNLVVSFFCLDWIKDQESLQQRIYRALKPYGKILYIISTGSDDVAKIVENVAKSPKWASYLDNHEIPAGLHCNEDYRKFIQQAGFTLDSFEVKQIPVELPDLDSFYQFIIALPLFGDVLTQAQNEDIAKDITEAFQNHCDKNYKGKLICIGEMLIVQAMKSDSIDCF